MLHRYAASYILSINRIRYAEVFVRFVRIEELELVLLGRKIQLLVVPKEALRLARKAIARTKDEAEQKDCL